MDAARHPRLILKDITKVYPGGVVANESVSLEVYAGEVLALLGENGAGKTTLVSIVAGYLKPDSGKIVYEGEEVVFSSPREAMERGIILVPQHPKLIDAFTAAENIALTYRLVKHRTISLGAIRGFAEKLSREYDISVDVDKPVRNLTMGERQKVEILKALILDAKLLLLDEPTTHLSPIEAENLAVMIRSLAEEGRSVVVITHRIKEALAMADRIAVMRRGRLVGVVPRERARVDMLLEWMFGSRRVVEVPRKKRVEPLGECVIRVEDLYVYEPTVGDYVVRGVSLCVRAGEVLGVAGIAGNGQRELFETLIGLRKPAKGRIYILGVDVTGRPPSHRGRLGLAIIPEDRLGWALVRGRSLVFNVAVGFYSSPRGPYKSFVVDWKRARELAEVVREKFSVKADSVDVIVDALSGGNMQRFIVGREVLKEPIALIAMNPTAGLDVDATMYVRSVISSLAAEKKVAVLLVSEDLEELMELSDEIVVMSRGAIVYRAKPPYDMDSIAKAMAGVAVA